MNDQDTMNEGQTDRESDAQGDEAMAQLLNLAGLRPGIPADVQRRVHAGVRQEWQSVTKRRQILRWSGAFALAASVLLAVTLNPGPGEIAMNKLGSVALVVGGSGGDSFISGSNINRNDTITTSSGQSVSIVLNDGLSLRVASNSSLHFNAADDFTLTTGKVYADSGQSIYRDRGITIHTDVGSAMDIGTQFVVEYLDGNMAVAVREGRVDVSQEQESYLAVAGEKLFLQPDTSFVITPISVNDSSWDWAVALAPAFDIHNKPLLDFLKWTARELGKELVFVDNETRMAAMRAILRGSVANLSLEEALQSELATTKFQYRFDDFQIVISR
jgi:ferric-dicitrate binding protein FerR (iron transport regulator)